FVRSGGGFLGWGRRVTARRFAAASSRAGWAGFFELEQRLCPNCGRATMLTDTIKGALLEEIRFAKRKQWTITAAVVALIAGAYSAVQPRAFSDLEKVGATILVIVVMAGGICWLLYL